MLQFGILGIGAALFVSTNIDDVFVLLGFFSDRAYSARQVVAGQYCGMAALIVISAAGALAAGLIPAAPIGVLGLFPLTMGVWRLIGLRKSGTAGDPNFQHEQETKKRAKRRAKILSVAAVTIANGGDNISVYVPVFAKRPHVEIAELCAIFLVLTAVWCAGARALVTHKTVGRAIQKYGRIATPFVYIGLGVYILIKSYPLAAVLPHAGR